MTTSQQVPIAPSTPAWQISSPSSPTSPPTKQTTSTWRYTRRLCRRYHDIMRLGENKPNPTLVKTMVEHSRDVVRWLAETVQVPFVLSFDRQAYEREDGGKGLIRADQKALLARGVEQWFDTPAIELVAEEGAVTGVVVRKNEERVPVKAHSVVLACRGFESSRELRMKYLGPDWEHAQVRGTPYNTGDGISMAKAVGAKLTSDWQGCHSTCWDTNAPADAGDRKLSNRFTKSGYPLGVMVNIGGERFVDEGLDTYAKFGRQILVQPEACAFQVWDTQVLPWLRKEEYGDDVVEKIVASTIKELADGSVKKGLRNKESFFRTIRGYNGAIRQHRMEHQASKWDTAIKDGLSTQSSTKMLGLTKSNWALPIEKEPFLAVKVTCSITFTFGGLAIDPDTVGVLSESGQVIRGLLCTGEMWGISI